MTPLLHSAIAAAARKLRTRAAAREGAFPAALTVVLLGAAMICAAPAALAQRGNARPSGGGGGFSAARPANNFRAPAQRTQARIAPTQRQMSPGSAAPGRAAANTPVYRNGQPMAKGETAPAQAARPAFTNPQGPQITTQAPRATPGGGVPQMGAGNNMFQSRRQVSGGPVIQRGNAAGAGQGNAPHLNQWMQQHRNQSPEQQQRALQNEPGFNRLPAEQQQRLQQRLQQLNRMPEQDRQRTLNYIEGMERLSPQQRGQVNSALGQMRTLPQNQQKQVSRAFNQVRRLPPAERAGALQSYSGQLNPQQQQTLNNLMRAEPYLPLQR